jgi:hypothetical protein
MPAVKRSSSALSHRWLTSTASLRRISLLRKSTNTKNKHDVLGLLHETRSQRAPENGGSQRKRKQAATSASSSQGSKARRGPTASLTPLSTVADASMIVSSAQDCSSQRLDRKSFDVLAFVAAVSHKSKDTKNGTLPLCQINRACIQSASLFVVIGPTYISTCLSLRSKNESGWVFFCVSELGVMMVWFHSTVVDESLPDGIDFNLWSEKARWAQDNITTGCVILCYVSHVMTSFLPPSVEYPTWLKPSPCDACL